MKINTLQVLTDITGDPIMNEQGKPMTLGYAIGRMLVSHKDDPLRAYLLGIEIYKAGGDYQIATSDADYITQAVKSNENYIALVKGQVLELLTEKKEPVEIKKK